MNDADRILHTQPLTAEAFAPWGEVLDTAGEPDRLINEGRCGRWHGGTGSRWRWLRPLSC